MKNLLEFLLNRLVEHPDAVKVQEEQVGDTFIYTLHVHADDIGKVIGKQGSVINAIRTIAKVRAVKEQTRVRVDVAEADEAPVVVTE